MSAAEATCLMQAHQLMTINDMLLFHPSKYQDPMKIYNRQQKRQTNKFGMAVQEKVTEFIHWVNYLQQRQETII